MLTESQKQFIRDSATELSRAEMMRELDVPRHRVDKFCRAEGIRAVSGYKKLHSSKEYRLAQSRKLKGRRVDGKPAVGWFIDSAGYKYLTMHSHHPLANKVGTVAEHRVVLYEKIGPGAHDCYLCGKTLEWGGLDGICVDHLDGDRLNNDPRNLEPSCSYCNSRRIVGN